MNKLIKGKYVSRAAFAKMQAERDRIKKDIYFIVMKKDLSVFTKWEEKFLADEWLSDALREIAKQALPKLREKYPNMLPPKLDTNKKAFK